ncbi:hypothetical protein ON010_g12618 [Phytophthora cinnamomi]|nr:hypothetical protein ON010_g12618 [Phytophthora cinnamomi]
MEAVTRSVERAIAVEMPVRFEIMFDGWSHDSEHYIAVFACYEVDGGMRCTLLCMAPLVNEETSDFSAASHQAFLATMLARDYQKRPEQVLFLVGDNCGVNCRLATLMGVPLVGCASHRLNCAVAARLSECADDLDLMQALMIKLRILHHSAKLRPDFEAGCVRVLKGQAKRLTRAEKAALEPLLVSPPADEGEQKEKDEEAYISFVERLQKLRRLEERQPTYELLASIPPTSNVVEQFFSVARTTFGQQRRSLQPYTLEILLFLRQNAD